MRFYAIRYWRGTAGRPYLTEASDRYEEVLEEFSRLRETEGVSCPEIVCLKVCASMDMWTGEWKEDRHE